LSRGRICGEEGLEKLPWVDALSSGGLHQTGKDAVGFQSTIGSRSEAYFAEDHQMPERLFRVIVGGRYAGTPEESEEKFLLGTCEIGPESLGGFEAKRLFAEGVEFPDKAFFDLGRRIPGDMAGFELLPDLGSGIGNRFCCKTPGLEIRKTCGKLCLG
jgi:hypothetical protein